MITKVTSANYDDYTLLFNQADAALKEFNGEPTSEFVEVKAPVGELGDDDYQPGAAYDDKIQYFDENYSPVTFADAAAFASRDTTKKWYVLNEQVIYDLDTYFGRLEQLTSIDYSFLKLPLDEPTFDIVDDTSGGRRVIQVPSEFSTGISVEGDETAEILFFSIDRYYDATDLWSEKMNYVIQWKTASKNGVTRAFINKDSRPFLQDGKIYFGWPISSEITEDPGDVTFSVRIFRFGEGTGPDGRPKIIFGLNTQTAKVKINASINFKVNSETEFEDAETISKTADIISRVFNSTVIAEAANAPAATPQIIQNILSDATLAEALNIVTKQKDVFTLDTGLFDESKTYYNANQEPVSGLNENTYRPGVYYNKTTVSQNFYEFDYEDVKDELQQVKAVVESGILTYTARSCASPDDNTIGGTMQFISGDDIVYIPVTEATRLQNQRYYEIDEESGKFIVALHIATPVGEEWEDDDCNTQIEGKPCKYFERISPKLVIGETAPVGCYWIVVNNNEAKKAVTSVDSYKIWIPGPIDLTDEQIDDTGKSFDDENRIRTIVEGTAASMGITIDDVAQNNTVKYVWSKLVDGDYVVDNSLPSAATQTINYEAEDLPLLDEQFKVEAHTMRNKKESEEIVSREFRVTDAAHKFVFDVTADSQGEEQHPSDRVKIITQPWIQGEDNVFKIDFSANVEEGELTFVSDQVAYRLRQRYGSDTLDNIFYNDLPGSTTDGYDFHLATFDELKDMEFKMEYPNLYYYVELINIVNEDFDLEALNTLVNGIATHPDADNTGAWQNNWEAKTARTPYMVAND